MELIERIANKLCPFALATSEARGECRLFALIHRPEALGKWDLVISAPWIDPDPYAALQFLSTQVTDTLKPEELNHISRIVTVTDADPFLQNLTSVIGTRGGLVHIITHLRIHDTHIDDIWVIIAQRLAPPPFEPQA